MKKAILYARVAALEVSQRHDALQMQTGELKEYCTINSIEIVGSYEDLASGQSFEREEFQKLLIDLKSGNVKADLLLFVRWDRFSRNFFQTIDMIQELEKLGVKAMAINDKISSESLYRLVTRLKTGK